MAAKTKKTLLFRYEDSEQEKQQEEEHQDESINENKMINCIIHMKSKNKYFKKKVMKIGNEFC